jgi:DNA-directed RNA polymerase specialized sigma24 family protein
MQSLMNMDSPCHALLADRSTRRQVGAVVRKRVPRGEVEDVVQEIYCHALAADDIPTTRTDLLRWVMGITRHKIADFYRRLKREPRAALPEMVSFPAPFEARSVLEHLSQEAR